MAEKEREARRMQEEALRVGKHADRLKRDRASSLQEIESKLRLLSSSNFFSGNSCSREAASHQGLRPRHK